MSEPEKKMENKEIFKRKVN